MTGHAKIKKSMPVKFLCISTLAVQKCGMATLDGDDLKAIKDLIEVTFDEKLDKKLHANLRNLLTKDEFYGKMDEVMGELKATREAFKHPMRTL